MCLSGERATVNCPEYCLKTSRRSAVNTFLFIKHHILGNEGKSGRGRYEVQGDFVGLPELEPREECSTCTATPYRTQLAAKVRPEEALSPRLKVAAELAGRVHP